MTARVRSNEQLPSKIVIMQDAGDSRLLVLLKDYELTLNHIEGIDGRLIQVIGGILGVLGIVIGIYLNQKFQLSVGLAWITPLFFLILITFLVFFIYQNNVYLWNARILANQINTIIGEKVIISYDPQLPGAAFLSPERGSLRTRIMYIALFCGTFFLFIVVTVSSLSVIYNASHIQGSLFVLFYGFLVAILSFSSLGLIYELPRSYRIFLNQLRSTGHISNEFLTNLSAFKSNISGLFSVIIPRLPDFITKSFFFIFGYVTAIVVVGLPASKLPLINYLFRSSTDWKSVSSVPVWVYFALWIVYFVVEEIFLQQAKLMWDDIRDIERDKILLQNSTRPIASGRLSVTSAIWQMYVRWSLAFLFSYLLGGFALLLVFFFITFHQAVYVLWAKPRSSKHPLIVLFTLSFNVSLRFLAGVVSIAGAQWSLTPFVLLFVLCYFYPVGVMALLWKIEAEYQRDTHQNIAIRPQSEFYLRHGEFWQHVGLIAAVVVAGAIFLNHVISLSCNTGFPYLQTWYLRCGVESRLAYFDNIGPVISIILIVGLIIIFMLLAFLFVRLFEKMSNLIVPGIRKIKGLLVAVLVMINIPLFILSIIKDDMALLLLGFLVFSIALLFVYEGMTYLEYTFTNLKIRMLLIAKVIYAYLFQPIPNLGLKEVLAIMFTDIDPAKFRLIFPEKEPDQRERA